MRISLKEIPKATIEEFANAHDLTMNVCERRLPEGDPSRYYAMFAGAEVLDGRLLVGAYGNGPTPEDAIAAYARDISMKTIVVAAYQPSRREIEVPRLA